MYPVLTMQEPIRTVGVSSSEDYLYNNVGSNNVQVQYETNPVDRSSDFIATSSVVNNASAKAHRSKSKKRDFMEIISDCLESRIIREENEAKRMKILWEAELEDRKAELEDRRKAKLKDRKADAKLNRLIMKLRLSELLLRPNITAIAEKNIKEMLDKIDRELSSE